MAKVIIFGCKVTAELAHYYLTEDSNHEVVAFCVNKKFMPKIKTFKLLNLKMSRENTLLINIVF